MLWHSRSVENITALGEVTFLKDFWRYAPLLREETEQLWSYVLQ